MGFGMNDFNLKKALAGEKVTTEGGDEVTQLTLMNVDGVDNLVGVYKRQVLRWNNSGASFIGCDHVDLHLKMAPDMGSGFLYVYDDGMSVVYKEEKDWFATPVMIFDLSDYPIGFGLEKKGK